MIFEPFDLHFRAVHQLGFLKCNRVMWNRNRMRFTTPTNALFNTFADKRNMCQKAFFTVPDDAADFADICVFAVSRADEEAR